MLKAMGVQASAHNGTVSDLDWGRVGQSEVWT